MKDHAEVMEMIKAIPHSAWRRNRNHQSVRHQGKEIAVRPLFDGSKVFVEIRSGGRKEEWFTCDRSEVIQPNKPSK